MKNNIDKDIEICKELIRIEHANWIGLTNQEAIENVLSELETYKKIAEKLAKSMVIGINIDKRICEDKENCLDYDNCRTCIIDWARKEVEKDE